MSRAKSFVRRKDHPWLRAREIDAIRRAIRERPGYYMIDLSTPGGARALFDAALADAREVAIRAIMGPTR